MKDKFGDEIRIDVTGREIDLDVQDRYGPDPQGFHTAALTPKKARKLAKKLKRAARKAESYD